MNKRKLSIPMIILIIVSSLLLLMILIPWPQPATPVPKKVTHPRNSQGGLTQHGLTPAQLKKIERLITLTLQWSKKDGTVHQPTVDELVKAGMSSQLATTYQPVWDSIFTPVQEGAVSDESLQVTAIEEATSTVTQDRLVDVSAVINPHWTAKDGSLVLPGKDEIDYTVHYNVKTNEITQVTQPDPQSLYFSILPDGSAPQPSPDGTGGYQVIPPSEQ